MMWVSGRAWNNVVYIRINSIMRHVAIHLDKRGTRSYVGPVPTIQSYPSPASPSLVHPVITGPPVPTLVHPVLACHPLAPTV